MQLTKREVDKLSRNPETTVFYWDDELPGFGLRITTNGIRSYVLRYRLGKVQKWVTVGRHGVLTPDEARKLAGKMLLRINEGEPPRTPVVVPKEIVKVKDLAKLFIEKHVDLHTKASTAKEYKRMLNKVILPELGESDIFTIDRAGVEAFQANHAATIYSANRYLAVLSKMFNLAEEWKMRPQGSNPCMHIKKFKESRRDRFLTQDEKDNVMDALEKECAKGGINATVATAIQLLLLTGARKSEILSLRWDYVHTDSSIIYLPDSKTGRKSIPISNKSIAKLKTLRKQDPEGEFVFPSYGKSEHLVELKSAWERICETAGISGVRIHDLRHSFASFMAQGGASLPEIGFILGHKQASTTQRYAHLIAAPILAKINAVERKTSRKKKTIKKSPEKSKKK